MKSATTRGVLAALAGTALFTPIFAAGKMADGAYPALALMAMRYAGGFLTVVVILLFNKTPLSSLRSNKPHQHLVRAMLGTGGGVFTIHAASVIPIAYATAIGLIEGLLIIALAGLILKEHITRRHWIAGLVAAGGAYLVVHQSLSGSLDISTSLEGLLSALLGAVFIALEALLIKTLARRESALGVLLHVNAFGMIITTGLCLILLDWINWLTPAYFLFILMGPIAIAGQFFNIKAYRLADAATLAPVHYSWLVFASLLGLAFFNEVPTLVAALGASFILIGGVLAARTQTPIPPQLMIDRPTKQ